VSGLVIVGADVLGRLVAEAAGDVRGFVDDRAGAGDLGTLADLERHAGQPAFVAIGDNAKRRLVAERVRAAGLELATVVHPRAFVSPSAALGAGVFVDALASVNAGASVADGVIVMPHAWVGHDAEIGAYAWLSGHAAVGGYAHVGAAAKVGVGAILGGHARVDEGAVVAAGARVER
jgi:UDP-3-O-[3-hydroxymyristoyl] glucosamine N-acyltransferase